MNFMLVFLLILTIATYSIVAVLQRKYNLIWLNPMLITISVIAPFLLYQDIPYDIYQQSTQGLSFLIEPAVVALGYPLFKQLQQIKKHWRPIVLILASGVFTVIVLSLMMTMMLLHSPEIAISLSLKSVTNPIGIALTEQLQGNSSITAVAIIVAGLFGALLGPAWLNLINVRSAAAQGLAIGASSHVIGTASMAKLGHIHAAYSSIALIISALLTALISPWFIPILLKLAN